MLTVFFILKLIYTQETDFSVLLFVATFSILLSVSGVFALDEFPQSNPFEKPWLIFSLWLLHCEQDSKRCHFNHLLISFHTKIIPVCINTEFDFDKNELKHMSIHNIV